MVVNSCIVDTVYALALYLLYMPMSAIDNTRFFVGSVIPHTFDKELRNVVRFDTKKFGEKISLLRFLSIWTKCLFCRIFLVSFTNVFGQDHLGIFGLLTGFKEYSLIEDSPGVFSGIYKTSHYQSLHKKRTLLGLLLHVLRFGMIPSHCYGQSKRCINRIITEPSDAASPLVSPHRHELVSINELWDRADSRKKTFIRNLFGLTNEVVNKFSQYETVFLTQPFREDCNLSDDEWKDVVDVAIGKCDRSLFIKVHPRDKFNYEKYYPKNYVMRSAIPMQLFTAMGVRVKRAITISSSAIRSFPDSVEKIVLGTNINEKIFAFCGKQS